MNLAELDEHFRRRYADRAMAVLYNGIANFEDDPRLVELSRMDLEQFAGRLDRVLKRNRRAA